MIPIASYTGLPASFSFCHPAARSHLKTQVRSCHSSVQSPAAAAFALRMQPELPQGPQALHPLPSWPILQPLSRLLHSSHLKIPDTFPPQGLDTWSILRSLLFRSLTSRQVKDLPSSPYLNLPHPFIPHPLSLLLFLHGIDHFLSVSSIRI